MLRRRSCHEATLARLAQNKKASRARDLEKDVQIKELQAQLLALQNATEQRLAAIESRERDVAAREMNVQKVERRQAQVHQYLSDKETKLHHDRIALEQLRTSIKTRVEDSIDRVVHPPVLPSTKRVRLNSTSASISEVSIELGRGTSLSSRASTRYKTNEPSQANTLDSFESCKAIPCSERHAVRRKGNKGNLHRQYAPASRTHQSQIPVPVVCSERKLPSEGDLRKILSVSRQSNIPISTRIKKLRAEASSGVTKPESGLQTTKPSVTKQPKTVHKSSVAVCSPSVAQPRYNTRSVARNANKAGALPRLWI
jgi:hypothetical protein